MRFNNASASTKKSVELNNFLGVDFSSAPTNVSTKRASFAKNLVSEDGVNQKRPGWETLIDFSKILLESGGYSNETIHINGIFKTRFKLKNRFEDLLLVQANGVFYKVEWDEDKKTYISKQINPVDDLGGAKPYHYDYNSDRTFKSQAFLSNNRLYIIGGGGYYVYYPKEVENFEEPIYDKYGKLQNKKEYLKGDVVEYKEYIYYCEKATNNETPPSGYYGLSTEYWSGGVDLFRLRSVIDDVDTYIPTTTIGILPKESGDTSRSSLDKINLLSSYRYNKLRGVDSSVTPSKTSDETPVEYYSFKLDSDTIRTDALIEIQIENNSGIIKLLNYDPTAYGGEIFETNLYNENGTKVGWVDGAYINLINTLDITPPTTTEDNIIVKFSPYLADDTIINCEFGCRFGFKGNDTLFLSGNKNYPNQDFFSYTVKEDFTYFPADNIEKFGTTPVKAYLRVADGTLAILKETSNSEPSIYYRSVSYVTNSIGATEIQYPVVQGASGEGAINAYTCETLVGDSLFASSNGIFGLTLSENVVINDRYARERDKYIHSKLIKHDLTKAVSTVYKGKYLLAVDGVCYVMDSRFKNTSHEDADDTFSYECWYWDNIPANYFCSYGDELYFGTEDGKVCRFKQEDFVDEKIVNIGVVLITPFSEEFEDNNIITISNDFKYLIKNGNKVRLKSTYDNSYPKEHSYGVYTDLVTKPFSVSRENLATYYLTITFEEDVSNEFKVGQEICLFGKSIGSEENIYYQGVWVRSVNNNVIEVYSQAYIIVSNDCSILKTNLKDKWFYITDYDGENSFKLANKNGELVSIYGLQNVVTSYIYGEFLIEEPVKAIWQSAVLDLGLYDYSKNLDSLSVVLSPDYHGKVRFGYETKRVTLDLMAKQIKSAETEQSHHFFDFDNIDFNNFTFETAFASSYTKRIRERNVNYIMFKAVMNDEHNSALMSIKVDYSIYKKNRGVR